jgi:hypothetical protein
MDEAHMIQSNSSNASEPDTVRHNAGQILHDVVTLSELQARLCVSDAREFMGQTMLPVAVFTAGLVLLLAAIPLCLVAIALGLVAAGLPPVGAYALVAGLSLVAAATMVLWARQTIWKLPAAFARSREEFARNVAWVKNVFTDLAARPEQAPSDWGNPPSN